MIEPSLLPLTGQGRTRGLMQEAEGPLLEHQDV